MPAISSSAPGKVILCGEHAVVYGKPAIAIPVLDVRTNCVVIARPNAFRGDVLIKGHDIALDCRLDELRPDNPLRKTIELVLLALSIDHLPACEIQIRSTIPVGGGLGSSASVTVALTRALSAFLGHPFDNETVNDIAFEIEKLHHGTPSGIDNSVVTYAKPLYFVKGSPIQWLEIKQPLQFLIANSGIKGSTGKAVNIVREKWNSSKNEVETIFENIGDITKDLFHVLHSGTPQEAGSLMTKNHDLLLKLGISLPILDTLVDTAIITGAYGAKLTGGGLGGNIIVLVPPEKSDQISRALQKAGAVNVIRTQLHQEKGNNQ